LNVILQLPAVSGPGLAEFCKNKNQNGTKFQFQQRTSGQIALVTDEGETHVGKEEIQKWNEHTNEKYQSKIEPIGLSEVKGETVLSASISGPFEGSPLILKYIFGFDGDKIFSLRIE